MLTVLNNILNADELRIFQDRLKSTVWSPGKRTAGGLAGEVKNNEQLDDSDENAQWLSSALEKKLLQHPGFISAALPQKIYPPKFNRYAASGHYGIHVDSAVMVHPVTGEKLRTDLSATLFLAEPHSYEGGVLPIETAFGAQEVKLAAGDMVLYPSSSLHQVTPVTEGERLAAFFWIQSMVPRHDIRAMLYDLDQSIQSLTPKVSPKDQDLLRLSQLYHNLLRESAQL